jgi:hypothetical protein
MVFGCCETCVINDEGPDLIPPDKGGIPEGEIVSGD